MELIGKRVQLHPATDQWMKGDRYGTITEEGTVMVSDWNGNRRPQKIVWVHLDKSGKTQRFTEANVELTGDDEEKS